MFRKISALTFATCISASSLAADDRWEIFTDSQEEIVLTQAGMPDFSGESFGNAFGLIFPEGSIQINKTETGNIQLITVISPFGVEETLMGFISQLRQFGIDAEAETDGSNTRISVTGNPGYMSITAYDVEEEPESVVQIKIEKN